MKERKRAGMKENEKKGIKKENKKQWADKRERERDKIGKITSSLINKSFQAHS